ncbi:MAG: hypothetical protein ABIP94_14860 [Planctomycetota bacterium]
MLLLSTVLAACSSGGETGSSGGGDPPPGGGGGGPGSGGGPGGPGGSGNPLSIVLDFSVKNQATTARTETIRASVPFPEGAYPSLQNIVVSGHQTAWMPLQYWADGTIKVAQAQFTDTLNAGQTKTYVVARDEPAATGPFTRNAWVAQVATNLELGAEVKDTFSVPYRGFIAGAGTVVQETPLMQTKRWRTYHTAVPGQTGIGRDYLTSMFYVTEYRDMPFLVVDWIVGSDYLGADSIPPGNTDPNLRALGTVDVRSASFLCKGATEVLPYRPTQEGIGALESLAGGYTAFKVMTDTYITDAQTRRYRFVLRCEPSGASPEEAARWQASASAIVAQPMYALGSQRAWQETAAAGLLGGPIPGPADSAARAEGEYQSFAGANFFGTWGTHGDIMITATTGTPRNAAMSVEFAHALQGQNHRLLQRLEQMAWAQAMRPYHLWNLQVGAEQQILLWDGTPMLLVQGQSLGRRALRDNDPYPQYRSLSVGQPRAHGWFHFDHEHWSCDLLFDYYTVTGDAWAKEELRQLGQSLKGLLRLNYYYTSIVQPARAEGWCLQGFVQIYQATQDNSIRDYDMRRVNEIVDVHRQKTDPSKAMVFQDDYPNTFYPSGHQFFMPWHHGAVLWGYLGAYKAWGEPVLLQIAEDVATTVEYSWVTNVTSSIFGSVAQGLRYYVPARYQGNPVPANYWDTIPSGIHFGDSPLGGAHTFLIGGLHYLATMTSNSTVRTKALLYGGMLLGNMSANDRWNKWNFCLPIQYAN